MKISKFVCLASLVAASATSFAQTLTHVEPAANNVDAAAAPTSIKLAVADSSGATLNKVEVSSDGGSNWADASSVTGTLADGQTVVVGGLTAATAYQFRLDYNSSEKGAAVSATTKNAILGTTTVESVDYPFITVNQASDANQKFINIHNIKSSDGSSDVNKFDITVENDTEVTDNGVVDLYNNYTSKVASPISGLTAGTSYKYEVTFEKSDWNGINIWADWNRDGDFLDSGEVIMQKFGRRSSAFQIHTVDFTVPAGTTGGDILIRCRMFAGNNQNAAITANDAWGYTENKTTAINDFKITVGAASVPDTLTINSATANTSGDKFTEIALAVTEGGVAEVERVEVSTDGGSSWNTATVADINANPIVVTGLTQGTSYAFRLVDTDPAVTSATVNGSTAAYSLTIDSATANTSGDKFTQIALAVSKDGATEVERVDISTDGGSSWNTATVADINARPIVVTGLTEGTTYAFRLVDTSPAVTSATVNGSTAAYSLTIDSVTPVTGNETTQLALDVTKDGSFSVVKVEKTIAGADAWSDATATDLQADPIVVTGLLPGNDYDFRVTYNTDSVSAVATGVTNVVVTAVTGGPNDTKTLMLKSSPLSYVNTTISGVQGDTDRTVCAWIKTTGTNATIVAWGHGKAGQQNVLLLDGNGKLRLEVGSGARVVDTALNDDSWHHVAYTFNGTTLDDVVFYVDGVVATNTSANDRTLNTQDNNKVRIGADISSTIQRGFVGELDELGIFSRAFSRNEIANIYNEGNGRGFFAKIKNDAGDTNLVNDSNLVAYYDASAGITNSDPKTTPIVINAAGDTSDGTLVGDVVTPAIGLYVEQTGTLVKWTVERELDVLEYQVVDAETLDVLEVVTVDVDANGAYSVTLEKDVAVKLIVIDKDGTEQTFRPANGNEINVEYNLIKGWNLIATVGTDSNLSEVEAATAGTFWGWNGSTYVIADTDEAYTGMWVYAPTAVKVDATALKADSTVMLAAGWNLAGPANNIDVPASIDGLFTWSQTYEDVLEKYDTLYQGIGYWFFVTEDTEVDLK